MSTTASCPALLLELTRGPIVESRHYGHVAVVDSTGRLLYQAGDPHLVTYLRSSAKPIQAIPVVESGAAEHFELDDKDLALICASHSSTEEHTGRVLKMLEKLGLEESALQCGPHLPFDAEAAAVLHARGLSPTPVHSNCSGKHTGMLALARQMRTPVEGYLEPTHAVQQRVLEAVADVCGISAEDIAIGVDGCGVPVFGMPLERMAYGFSRVADPSSLLRTRAKAAVKLRDAMRANPYLVAGKGRLDTDLMQAAGDRLFSKGGAEGVHCIGVLPGQATRVPEPYRSLGIGVAVKADDGATRAASAIAVEVMRQLGALEESQVAALATYRVGPIKNLAERVVGEMRPAFALEPVAAQG